MMEEGDLLTITVLLLAHLIIGKFYFDDLVKNLLKGCTSYTVVRTPSMM